MSLVKQSTARTLSFFMVDSTDSITGKTGLSPTVTLSKNGAAFGAAGGVVSEIGSGWYALAANTTDTGTLGDLLLHATAAGADPSDSSHQVVVLLPGEAVTVQAGTGTGQLDFTSGVLKSNLVQILGTALTETAGQIAAAFKKWFDVATPTGTVNSIPNTVAGAAGGLFIAGTNAATTITTALTTTFTGNLTGSVASVTALSGAAVQSIWDALTSALTTVNSIGKLLVTNVNAAIGSIPTNPLLASGYTAPDNTTIATINTKLGTPASSVSADIAAVKVDTAAIKVKTDQLAFTSGNVNANTIVASAQIEIKKNTALANFEFPMVDSSGNPLTGLTVTVQRSIDGAALAAAANAASEVGSGVYKINLAATDLNGDVIGFVFSASTAKTLFLTVRTQV